VEDIVSCSDGNIGSRLVNGCLDGSWSFGKKDGSSSGDTTILRKASATLRGLIYGHVCIVSLKPELVSSCKIVIRVLVQSTTAASVTVVQ
jgi:hypothetical protein